MPRVALVLSFLLYAGAASAYTIADGSGSGIDPAGLDAALTNIAGSADNPDSAQFRRLRYGSQDQTIVCGEMDVGDRWGFRRFYAKLDGSSYLFIPSSSTGWQVICGSP